MTEPETTYEEDITRRYQELGVKIRDLEGQRDALKNEEIMPAMEDGVLFTFGDSVLVWEFVERVDFDHKGARAAGRIPDDVWKDYTAVTVSRRLMVRKRSEDQKQAEQQKLTALRDFLKETNL